MIMYIRLCSLMRRKLKPIVQANQIQTIWLLSEVLPHTKPIFRSSRFIYLECLCVSYKMIQGPPYFQGSFHNSVSSPFLIFESIKSKDNVCIDF